MKAFARLLSKDGAPPSLLLCPDRVPEHNVNPNFFEKQESLGCGRHALNNLLGGKYFKKEGLYVPGVNPIPLDGLCQSLKSSMQAINASKGEVWNARRIAEAECQDSENYDQNTLKAGLNILGFQVEADKGRAVTDSSRTYGFLINTARAGFHWVSLRKVNEGYRYFDSMEAIHGTTNPTGELFASLKAFKDKHSSYPVFLEVIKPEPRICIEPLRDYGRLQVVECPFKDGQEIHFEGTNYTVVNRHMNGTECDYLDVVRSDIYDPRLISNIQSSIVEVGMFLDKTLLKMLIRDGNIVGFINRDVILQRMKASIDEKVRSAFRTKNRSNISMRQYNDFVKLQGRLNAAIREEGGAGDAAFQNNADFGAAAVEGNAAFGDAALNSNAATIAAARAANAATRAAASQSPKEKEVRDEALRVYGEPDYPWITVYDNTYNRVFYSNTATNETTWIFRDTMSEEDKELELAVIDSAPRPPAPWLTKYHIVEKRIYYVNPVTKKSVYTIEETTRGGGQRKRKTRRNRTRGRK
jgi:hypothetical protein